MRFIVFEILVLGDKCSKIVNAMESDQPRLGDSNNNYKNQLIKWPTRKLEIETKKANSAE